jgi:hypothetical protein
MLRSRTYNGRSILCLDLAPPEGEDVGKFEEGGRTATAQVIDPSLLTAIAGARGSLLSRDHGRGLELVASCEPARTLAGQSIAGIPLDSDPPICEPCGIWVSLGSHQD